MKWFKHDSDANLDAKLQEVLLDYGLEGYGLYWYCVELIAHNVDKDNITFELEHDARIIARNTGSSPQKVEEMMAVFVKLGLFENSSGRISCLKLSKRIDDTNSKNPQIKQIQKLIGKTPRNSEKLREIKHDEEDEMGPEKTYINQELGESRSNSEKVGETPSRGEERRREEIRLDNSSSPSSSRASDGRERFPMHLAWKPNFNQVTQKALNIAGLTDTDMEDQLKKYIAVKIDDTGDQRTQHEWDKAFKNSLMKFANSLQGDKSHEKNQRNNTKFDAAIAIANAPGAQDDTLPF